MESEARPVLEPIDRISEVLFGLIMVLGFTGSMSAADAGQGQVRTLLYGAIGCNIAWGLIDAIMFLMAALSERGGTLRTIRMVRTATDPHEGRGIVRDALPRMLGTFISEAELERLRLEVVALPESRATPRLTATDVRGALAVFSLCFISTFPVVIPFLLLSDVQMAIRTSNLIAVSLLFVTGYWFGRCAELRPWLTGIAMVAVGSLMVAATMALGG